MRVAAVAAFLCGLVGCDSRHPRVYDIPADAPASNAPGDVGSPPDPARAVASELSMALQWSLPAGWQAVLAGPMRLAVYTAPDGVELSVSRFPGTVGGDLANVNRWRGQLGLAGVAELTDVPGLVERNCPAGTGRFLELFADEPLSAAGMRTFWIFHQGDSWFFKAVGSRQALTANREQFDGWIQSIAAR
ncbi:MAG: hypothetical protein ACI81V_000651 [Lentimonas sp.]|jgi:hypothetical protein